jgi:hypothetical protein
MRAWPNGRVVTHGHDGIRIMAEIEKSWACVVAWLTARAVTPPDEP